MANPNSPHQDTRVKETQQGTPDPAALADTNNDQRPEEKQLPNVQQNYQPLRTVAKWGLDAVRKANDPPTLFQQGTKLVRIRQGEHDVMVEALTIDSLRGHLDRSANYVRVYYNKDGDTKVPGPPHLDFVKDMLTLPWWPADAFPVLKGVVRCPVFTANGTLIDQPGYNAVSGLWYQPTPGFVLPAVPSRPSKEDVLKANQLLLGDLFVDFPFEEQEDRANAVGYLLTPFARHMFVGPTPMGSISAPAPASGKGKLAQCIAIPALERLVPVTAAPVQEEEWQKTLTSLLLQNPQWVLFDNVKMIKSAALEAALTGDNWLGRLLGKNETITVPITCGWLLTANNLPSDGDLGRRQVEMRLNAKMERPEDRDPKSFKHQLPDWALEHRSALVWAALVLVRNWIVMGKTPGRSTVASYESWAATIGGILGAAGIEGFLGNLARQRRLNDDEGSEWRAFCREWWDKHAAGIVGIKELFEIIKEKEFFGWLFEKHEKEAGQKQALGKLIKRMQGRRFAEYEIVYVDDDNSSRHRYKLVEVVDPVPLDPENKPFAQSDKAEQVEVQVPKRSSTDEAAVSSAEVPELPRAPERRLVRVVTEQHGGYGDDCDVDLLYVTHYQERWRDKLTEWRHLLAECWYQWGEELFGPGDVHPIAQQYQLLTREVPGGTDEWRLKQMWAALESVAGLRFGPYRLIRVNRPDWDCYRVVIAKSYAVPPTTGFWVLDKDRSRFPVDHPFTLAEVVERITALKAGQPEPPAPWDLRADEQTDG